MEDDPRVADIIRICDEIKIREEPKENFNSKRRDMFKSQDSKRNSYVMKYEDEHDSRLEDGLPPSYSENAALSFDPIDATQKDGIYRNENILPSYVPSAHPLITLSPSPSSMPSFPSIASPPAPSSPSLAMKNRPLSPSNSPSLSPSLTRSPNNLLHIQNWSPSLTKAEEEKVSGIIEKFNEYYEQRMSEMFLKEEEMKKHEEEMKLQKQDIERREEEVKKKEEENFEYKIQVQWIEFFQWKKKILKKSRSKQQIELEHKQKKARKRYKKEKKKIIQEEKDKLKKEEEKE